MKDKKRRMDVLEQNENKYFYYYQLMNQWLTCVQEGKFIHTLLSKDGIRKIAIYGMGDMADRIFEDLENSDVKVVYGIDRDVSNTKSKIATVFSLADELPQTDLVIVTPFMSYDAIEKTLLEKRIGQVCSIEDIIYSL